MQPDEKLALNKCDNEPVHIPGRIQPFGALLGFDLNSGEIQYQSENVSAMLGEEEANCLGQNYEGILDDRTIVHAIRGALGLPTIRSQRERLGLFELNGQAFDLSLYATSATAVLEAEPNLQPRDNPQSPVALVQSMMLALRKGKGVEAFLDSCVQALRLLTGHDRVMAYRFLENHDGEVVAEAKAPGLEPYLGLRYPAWDIPTQVRQIMLRAPFRVIADTRAEPVPVLGVPGASPLDMTLSHLRGVSPIHVEYLENMGVRATMNTSIVVRGRLWGLFAFHHERARGATADQRSICELFGQLASMHLQQEVEQERFASRQRVRSTLDAIENSSENVDTVVSRLSNELMGAVDSDGLGIIRGDETTVVHGETTSLLCANALAEVATEDVLSVDKLQAVPKLADRSFGASAGALMLRLPGDAWLAFFRNEIVQEIRWAGQKEKEITYGPNGPRLSPRGSFAEYRESVQGRCRAWTENDLASASQICRELWKRIQVSSEAQSRQLERQKQYQDLLIAELNHRVKNTLALVRSIARQTTSSSVSIEQYVEMLEQRIAALSKAHDLVGGSGLQWARIEDLVAAELKPFEFDNTRVSVEGAMIAIRADVAPILALLFHEMISNAAKHGALSPAGGTLQVRWYADAGGVSIRWREDVKGELSEPERRGFGLALIERALPYECNGRSSIEFGRHHLETEFWLPAETIDHTADTEQAQEKSVERTESVESLDLSDLEAILILEDNLVLAMETERNLLDLGVTSVDSLPNTELAMAAIDRVDYDCAILDINLGDETSFEVAERLTESGIGVVLVSGYDSKYQLPASLVRTPRLTKPVGRVDLVNAIRHTLRGKTP
ncbi:MAG: HWE histidine kinase domain-containing protein [Planctomycetota bacterium]